MKSSKSMNGGERCGSRSDSRSSRLGYANGAKLSHPLSPSRLVCPRQPCCDPILTRSSPRSNLPHPRPALPVGCFAFHHSSRDLPAFRLDPPRPHPTLAFVSAHSTRCSATCHSCTHLHHLRSFRYPPSRNSTPRMLSSSHRLRWTPCRGSRRSWGGLLSGRRASTKGCPRRKRDSCPASFPAPEPVWDPLTTRCSCGTGGTVVCIQSF